MTLCGILTGMETTLSIHQTYFRHLRIHGIYLGTRAEYDEVLQMHADGRIHVPIGARYPLSEGKKALAEFMTTPHFGKVILTN
jgi:NADPH:quinone reductase-like Zn-dependent oxidoreductase